MRGYPYQSAVTHELGELGVGPVLDLLLEDAERHGVLDHVIVVGDVALVDAPLERPRGVMAAMDRVRKR